MKSDEPVRLYLKDIRISGNDISIQVLKEDFKSYGWDENPKKQYKPHGGLEWCDFNILEGDKQIDVHVVDMTDDSKGIYLLTIDPYIKDLSDTNIEVSQSLGEEILYKSTGEILKPDATINYY
jgi:hypothetical protein